MFAEFACANLAAKFCNVNLLNFCVVIYLLQSVFLTKLLTLGTLFWTAVRAVIAPKLVILGILPLTSFMLVLIATAVAKLVILAIFSST